MKVKPEDCECIYRAAYYSNEQLSRPPEHHENCEHALIRVLEMSPELADGSTPAIALTEEDLIESINNWITETGDDQDASFTVSVKYMTRTEINNLEEI